MKPQDFIGLISKPARESMLTSKIPASFIVAQGALESAWGESALSKEAFNLFGVKADKAWTGDVYSLRTREYLNGQWVTVPANWRKYKDWLDCINDHAAFLQRNPRYKDCFKHNDGINFAIAVEAAGYATDPMYAEKIASIIRKYKLEPLDVVGTQNAVD